MTMDILTKSMSQLSLKPQVKPPTTFLTLPRELRHRILLQTYDLPFGYDYKQRMDSIAWASTFEIVHPALVADAVYVAKQWSERTVTAKKRCADGPPGLVFKLRLRMGGESRLPIRTRGGVWVRVGEIGADGTHAQLVRTGEGQKWLRLRF